MHRIPLACVGVLAIILTAALSVAFASIAIAGSGRTDILVTGPLFNFHPDPGYELFADGVFFRIGPSGGGVATVTAQEPFQVVLRAVEDCDVVVRFTAEPGGNYVIRFDATGHAASEVTGGTDGAALASQPLRDAVCRLPETSPADTGRSSAPNTVVMLATLIATIAGLLFYRRRTTVD